MFSSALRRQCPALLRRSNSTSIRSLISNIPACTVLRNSLKKPAPASVAQHRFFTVSPFLRNTAYAAERAADSDQPAGVYSHQPDGPQASHNYGDNEPITRFQQLADKGLVHPNIIDSIVRGMGFTEMTKVQRKTILETLGGEDVFGQAKTGTGKTIAFLLPVAQRIMTTSNPLRDPVRIRFNRGMAMGDETNADIRAIIISPTRELAQQIAVDARKLLSGSGIITQLAVGGSGKRESLADIRCQGCHILVATPGRLHDILTDRAANVSSKNLEILVLDEADHLLDQGFAEAIYDIIKLLPPRDKPTPASDRPRQTLLFSATVPDKVQNMVRRTMRAQYKFLKMVEKGEAATHEKVAQHLVRCRGLENQAPALFELLKREIEAVRASEETDNPLQPFKAIVFFTAVRPVALLAGVLRLINPRARHSSQDSPLYPAEIFEIHSRLSQSQRTRAADAFRRSKSGILLSSDVTARGMDFPGVTHVIQVGAPKSEETYIHRLGRTARGDRSGVGYLFLADMEFSEAARELRKLPLQPDKSIVTAGIDLTAEQEIPKYAADILSTVMEASRALDPAEKTATFLSLIGCYGSVRKQVLAQALNRLATLGWGMESPPSVPANLAKKIGVDASQGFLISQFEQRGDGDRGGFEGRGGRGGGRGGFGGRDGGGFGGRGGGGFGGRAPYSRDRSDGGPERQPFRAQDDSGGGFERRPYTSSDDGDDSDGGFERKPFRSRDGGDGGFRGRGGGRGGRGGGRGGGFSRGGGGGGGGGGRGGHVSGRGSGGYQRQMASRSWGRSG